jgi:hypothetical protein
MLDSPVSFTSRQSSALSSALHSARSWSKSSLIPGCTHPPATAFHTAPPSPLESTPVGLSASVDSKQLTGKLNSLESTFTKIPGGGSRPQVEFQVGQPILSVSLPSPWRPAHAPHVPLRRCRQSARITPVAVIAATRETSPLPAVSKQVRADIGFGIRRLPFPVASRSR